MVCKCRPEGSDSVADGTGGGSRVDGRHKMIAVSKKCIGLSPHLRMLSIIVSIGEKVHIMWAKATPPEKKTPGVAIEAATYIHST